MADDIGELIEAVLKLRRDLDEHKIATANMHRVGPVADRDHEKGLRANHGTDEGPDKSPWVQPSERSGIERYLPRQGEQVLVIAPYGDPEQGIAIPFGHSESKPNPAADADETVLFNLGKLRMSLKDDVLTIAVGKSKVSIADGKITSDVDGTALEITKEKSRFTGDRVEHSDRNIGKDHKHGQVRSGSEKTGDPEA